MLPWRPLVANTDKGLSRGGLEAARRHAALTRELAPKSAILDGEVVCLDDAGRESFTPLLFGCGRPVLAAFDATSFHHELGL